MDLPICVFNVALIFFLMKDAYVPRAVITNGNIMYVNVTFAVQFAEDRNSFYADRLHLALSGSSPDEATITRILAMQSKVCQGIAQCLNRDSSSQIAPLPTK